MKQKIDISIKVFEDLMKYLSRIDSDKRDYKITTTEYNRIKADDKLVVFLAGESVEDWADFKEKFIIHQMRFGLEWTTLQGQGGPLGLESIEIPVEVGMEIAKNLLDNKVKKGNFKQQLKNSLPNLFSYISNNKDNEILNIKKARTGFKESSKDKHGYRFTPGRNSQNFELSINEYSFRGEDTKKSEVEFGELILDNLKDALELNVLIHAQTGRQAGKYQNVDFEGFKVSKGISSDEFLMYNFELKPSNRISSISEAISQAINYKYESHFTYIVIPNFNQDSFYNAERFSSFLDLCSTNQIGIISIEMNVDTNEINDVIEVLKAERTSLDDISRLNDMIKESVWELCPLCNRIVHRTERTKCPWKVTKDDTLTCMKILLEQKVAD